jgi:signal transduction histidine kinase
MSDSERTTRSSAISDAPISQERSVEFRTEPSIDWLPTTWLEQLHAITPITDFPNPELVIHRYLHMLKSLFPMDGFAVRLKLPPSTSIMSPTFYYVNPHSADSLTREQETLLFPLALREENWALNYELGEFGHGKYELSSNQEDLWQSKFLHIVSVQMGMALNGCLLRLQLLEKNEQLRSLESQMIQSDKLASLGQIAAGVVHELNNPLTSIVAYSDYLIRKVSSKEEAFDDVERLERIQEAAQRILRFSQDLVTYARPSQGNIEPLHLHDVIKQSLVFCDHVIRISNAQIEEYYADNLPLYSGVPAELTQVFVNLVTNACHALPPENGCVVIETFLVKGAIGVRIRDNGHGVSAEMLSQIFEPFFTTKKAGLGSGLGLSIVQNIIARHGGHIEAQSDGKRGTTFEIRFPTVERERDTIHSPPSDMESLNAKPHGMKNPMGKWLIGFLPIYLLRSLIPITKIPFW